MPKLLALGDCNTLGVAHFIRNTYVERVARALGYEPINCGCTMATTREALRFFSDYYDPGCAIVTIQYGLVDSWRTFRFAPYVLYYPDNMARKMARKLVKKYKKVARRWGWNKRFGETHVVDPAEYRANIETIVRRATSSQVFLVETAPHQDPHRNLAIQAYNRILGEIATGYAHCRLVRIYDELSAHLSSYCFDLTHLNEAGHELIAARILAVFHNDSKLHGAAGNLPPG